MCCVGERMTVETWERRAEVPMILLALAFLVAYAWPVLNPNIDPDIRAFLIALSWTVYGAFIIDLAIRLILSEHPARYALSHWYDLVLVLIPMLRPLRLLRLIALIRILDRSVVSNLSGRVLVYVSGGATVWVGLSALAVLDVERGAEGANITSYGDALWWACVTVTTVGYGDFFPVTTQGRIIAVVLMLVGIGLVGSVTAAVATWILGRVQRESAQEAGA